MPNPTMHNAMFNECELEDLDLSNDPSYLGYQNMVGGWYIKKIDETSGTITYCVGDSNYDTSWTNRTSLTYTKFTLAFAII